MNGKIKFHKATGPAFNVGEIWISSTGSKVKIISVRRYPNAITYHLSDYSVTYYTGEGDNTHEKDAWNFQVRYTHQADVNL